MNLNSSGTLYIIPTPIGNLQDITLRSLEMLKWADMILCEDTRKTSILLNHFGIKKKLMSYHAFNEHQIVENIVNKLKENIKIVLVSDAGTPGISDPGFLLVRECLKNNIKINCLPGPSAIIPALINSGLPSDKFVFEGFIPVKKGRMTCLNRLKNETRSMVFYESPHRLKRTLSDFIEYFGPQRNASISREMTKIYEEVNHGTLNDLQEIYKNREIKGEIVIVVDGILS